MKTQSTSTLIDHATRKAFAASVSRSAPPWNCDRGMHEPRWWPPLPRAPGLDMTRTYEELKLLAQAMPPMNEKERALQGLSFAYGQLAASTRHKPQRAAFKQLAMNRGLTEAEFEEWANTRDGWAESPGGSEPKSGE